MREKVINKIDQLVKMIYQMNQKEIDRSFIEMLDGLGKYIGVNSMDKVDGILLEIQEAYIKKNYVCMADLLLYELKAVI